MSSKNLVRRWGSGAVVFVGLFAGGAAHADWREEILPCQRQPRPMETVMCTAVSEASDIRVAMAALPKAEGQCTTNIEGWEKPRSAFSLQILQRRSESMANLLLSGYTVHSVSHEVTPVPPRKGERQRWVVSAVMVMQCANPAAAPDLNSVAR